MQGSLEAEAKSKAEALRLKKKLETDINELEISLDHSNKAYADLQRSYKKTQGEFKELQVKFEEEQRLASELREQFSVSERRANGLHIELEEARTLLEQSDRARRQIESELADCRETFGNTNNQFGALTISKRKLDGEWQTLHVSISYFYSHSLKSNHILNSRITMAILLSLIKKTGYHVKFLILSIYFLG